MVCEPSTGRSAASAAVSARFAAGALPASFVGARLAQRLAHSVQRKAFGVFLIAFGAYFTLCRLGS